MMRGDIMGVEEYAVQQSGLEESKQSSTKGTGT